MVFTVGNYCGAINCSNNKKKSPHISFFRFPKDPERSRKWVVNCKREDLMKKDVLYLYRNIRLCALHFEPSQFMNTNKNKLIWSAVPTLFDVPNKPPQFSLKRKLPQRSDVPPKVIKQPYSTEATSLAPPTAVKKRKQTPAPKRQKATKLQLEEPRVPSPVATPGRKCFVCSKESGSTGSPLTALTATSKTKLHQKLSKIIGAELDIVVDEDGVICSVCCRLLNYLDRIEVEHRLLTKSVVDCMRWTSGLGSVRDDSRMPEAVLASIEDHSKNSKIPEEKCELGPDVSTQDTSDDAVSGSKTVIASNRDDERKNQTSLADRETEKKKNQTLNADRGTAKKKNQTLNADRVTEKKKNQTPPAGRVTERKKNQTGVVHRVIEEKPVAEQDTQNYHCKVCNFESKHKSVFVFHLQRHLQSGYRCDFCDVLLPKDLSYWIARMQQKVT